MPLYVADYLRDTRRLTAAEHGAYLLLIMEYWTSGALPDDDRQLSRIACMTLPEWRRARPLIELFFEMPGWKHARIEKEISRAVEISATNSQKAKVAADRRWAKHRSDIAGAQRTHAMGDAPSTNQALPQNAQSQSHSQKVGGGVERARDPMTEPKAADAPVTASPSGQPEREKSLISAVAFEVSTQVLAAMGLDPEHPLSVGSPLTVQGWFNAGWHSECILIGVQKAMQSRGRDGPPGTLKYFEKAIARAHADLTRDVPKVEIGPGETIRANEHGKATSTHSLGGYAGLSARLRQEIANEDLQFQQSAGGDERHD